MARPSKFAQDVHERQCQALLKAISLLMDEYGYTKYDFMDHGINKGTFDKFLESENLKAHGGQPLPLRHESVNKNLAIVLDMVKRERDRLEEGWHDAEERNADAACEKYKDFVQLFDEIAITAIAF